MTTILSTSGRWLKLTYDGSNRITQVQDNSGRLVHYAYDASGRLHTVTDGNRCYLPVEEQLAVGSILRAFPEEFAAHLEGAACPSPRNLVAPKVVDITDDGHVTYDERQRAKQPDWSYAAP